MSKLKGIGYRGHSQPINVPIEKSLLRRVPITTGETATEGVGVYLATEIKDARRFGDYIVSYEYYLNNPYYLDGEDWIYILFLDSESVYESLMKEEPTDSIWKLINREVVNKFFWKDKTPRNHWSDYITRRMIQEGYDGIHVPEDIATLEYVVVYKPNQVKVKELVEHPEKEHPVIKK